MILPKLLSDNVVFTQCLRNRNSSLVKWFSSSSSAANSDAGGGDNNDKGSTIDVNRLVNFFEKADVIVKEELGKPVQTATAGESVKPPSDLEAAAEITIPTTAQNDAKRRYSTAPRLVSWTSNLFQKESRLRKVGKSSDGQPEKSFATLFRKSTLTQLGNFKLCEVIGVVIEMVNDTDLYIDFGGKFHAVVSQPENSFYPRGSLVRVRLRNPEMTNQFMLNTKAISLHEADVTLIGPYRGQLLQKKESGEEDLFDVAKFLPFNPSPFRSNKVAVNVDNWKLE